MEKTLSETLINAGIVLFVVWVIVGVSFTVFKLSDWSQRMDTERAQEASQQCSEKSERLDADGWYYDDGQRSCYVTVNEEIIRL